MAKSSLPISSGQSRSSKSASNLVPAKRRTRKPRSAKENGDVLVSAVISSYLLTHLHHVLQRAEYGASSNGRDSQAANFAQLRKVLCMDARSMKDASALGMKECDVEKYHLQNIEQKVA